MSKGVIRCPNQKHAMVFGALDVESMQANCGTERVAPIDLACLLVGLTMC